ncbi:hypothetical protein [Undibacterium sp. TJN19]|uniref:hypothetical protein n=1 Tax=Undibacterium sp. TJN19 TaxID=3413055 RepID=UPI003BF0AE5A
MPIAENIEDTDWANCNAVKFVQEKQKFIRISPVKINYQIWKVRRNRWIGVLLIVIVAITWANMTVAQNEVQKVLFSRLVSQIPANVQSIYCYRIGTETEQMTAEMNCIYSSDPDSSHHLGSQVVAVPFWLGRDLGELDLVKGKAGMRDGVYLFAHSGYEGRNRWSHSEIFCLELLIDSIAGASHILHKSAP